MQYINRQKCYRKPFLSVELEYHVNSDDAEKNGDPLNWNPEELIKNAKNVLYAEGYSWTCGN